MTVLLTHTRLRLAAASTLLAVPLTAIGTLLVENEGLHGHGVALTSLLALAGSAASCGLLLRGNKLGVYLPVVGVTLVLLWSSLWAFRHGYAGLALYIILTAALGFTWASWTSFELGRSFFDPRIKWYQGLPKPLARVECEIGSQRFQVSRFDREGAFVFSKARPVPDFVGPEKDSQVSFWFLDRRIECQGVAVRTLDRLRKRSGVGIQFRSMSADSKKALGDFVESLKGEGYV